VGGEKVVKPEGAHRAAFQNEIQGLRRKARYEAPIEERHVKQKTQIRAGGGGGHPKTRGKGGERRSGKFNRGANTPVLRNQIPKSGRVKVEQERKAGASKERKEEKGENSRDSESSNRNAHNPKNLTNSTGAIPGWGGDHHHRGDGAHRFGGRSEKKGGG